MGTSDQPKREGFADHNVVAVVPDMEAARKAINALELGGIDAAHISLLGRRAEDAAEDLDTRQRDARVAKHVGKRVAIGAATGGAAGGIAGFVAGAVAFAIPGVGPVLGTGVWAATAAGIVAGGGVGGVVGGVSAVDVSEDWELTYNDVKEGRVLVGVHSPHREGVERGAKILRDLEPIRMFRFDAQGNRLQEG